MTNEQKTGRLSTHILAEGALMIALATVLSLIKVYEAPLGGAVTLLSMAPIIIFSMRRGIAAGLYSGFVFSIIQLTLGIANVGWVPDLWGKALCIILDYILPFTVLGLGGMFRKTQFSQNPRKNLIVQALLGTLVVTLIRFLFHVFSGVVIWYSLDLIWYADDPGHIVNNYPPFLFSLIYNGWFMVPEIIETAIGVPVIMSALSRIRLPGERGKTK